jgi:hypothetical protein
MSTLAPGRLALASIGLLWLGATSGCGRFALEPGPGKLQIQWTVNGERRVEVARGVPVLVQVEVHNLSRLPVRVPPDLAPWSEGLAGSVGWAPVQALPVSLPPGRAAEGWWVREDELPAGIHEVGMPPGSPYSALTAILEVSADVAGPVERLRGRATVARLTGTQEALAREVVQQQETEGNEWLPTTRLTVAELFTEAGFPEEALAQYEKLAEEVYGVETLPSWLQSRMRRLSRPGSTE